MGLVVGLLSSFLQSRPSHADSAREARFLDRVGPAGMPPLAHNAIAVGFDYTIASAEPTDLTSSAPIEGARAFAYSARGLIEAALVPRRWFLGLSYNVAAASIPSGEAPDSGASSFVSGNPEIWGRGLWWSRAGLSAGGGMGLIIPIPRSFTPAELASVRAIRVVRPWDYAHFQDLQLTARPFFDIRYVVGPVTLQVRQGIDFSVLLRDRKASESRSDIAALAAVYLGVKTVEWVTVGLAVEEVYQVTSDVTSPSCPAPCDKRRAQFTLSPSIQLQLKPIAPSVSAILPISTPLRGEVISYYAACVHLNLMLDAH